MRRLSRVVSLMAVDFAGLFAALMTALMVKELVKQGDWAWSASLDTTKDSIAFAYLLTVLLFAKEGLYADRAQRPGLQKIVSSLFQVTIVALIYALIATDRTQYNSYYIFYGTLGFAVVYVASLRWGYERLTGALLRAAGYRRRAVLVGSGKHIEDVAHALADEVVLAGADARLHLADAAAGQRAAVARAHRRPPARARRARRAGGHHRRPGLPAGPVRRAGRPVPPPRRARAHRPLDDGDPRPARRVRPGRRRAAVRAAPAGVRGLRLRRSSARSTSSARSCSRCC